MQIFFNIITDSGIPYSLRVTFVIIPKVPSEPTNRFVKLYPADVFLQKEINQKQWIIINM